MSCSYKLGIDAAEAMRNLNGTFIDVWTPEHDAAIRQDEREKVLDKVIQEINQATPEIEGKKLFITVLALMRRIDELRKEQEEQE